MKLAIILGTRPEIIKMSPIIRECIEKRIDFYILHTGQHYSYNMDRLFFEELNLPEVKYNLDVGSGLHGEQTAKMITGIEKILLEDRPDVILVDGDTNTVLAGVLAGVKLHIKVGHVEAGLRSFDRKMPEEINRILADHASDFLFPPTIGSRDILLKEGINKDKIYVAGNTIVDSVYQNSKIAMEKRDTLKKLGLLENRYMLITVHREENVESKDRLEGIFQGLKLVYDKYRMPIFFPIHPRTENRIKKFGINIPVGLELISPQGYLDFLLLEKGASLILTDSGGIQEESCILLVPCVTLRYNTERPETVDVGANVIAGVEPLNICKHVEMSLKSKRCWLNPYGNGDAGSKIVEFLSRIC